MERKQRAKMPASQRAKQFMPFAAVKGLEEAIVEQEQLLNRVERTELGKEQILAINETLKSLKKGDVVSVFFYSGGQYRSLQGEIERIDLTLASIRVKGTVLPLEAIKNLNRIYL